MVARVLREDLAPVRIRVARYMWIPLLLLSIAVTVVAARLLFSFGAPYVPVNDQRKSDLLELAGPVAGKKVVDLGSGDGRIVIAFAQAGAEAHGYEINPLLVFRARRNIKRAGLEGKAFIYWKDFWRISLSSFDVVTIFGLGFMMKRLEKKLKKELRKDSVVLSVRTALPTWSPTRSLRDVRQYSVASG